MRMIRLKMWFAALSLSDERARTIAAATILRRLPPWGQVLSVY